MRFYALRRSKRNSRRAQQSSASSISFFLLFFLLFFFFQFSFYFYLFGAIFLLLDTRARATRLPATSGGTYRVWYYRQVHLPEEATASRARDAGGRALRTYEGIRRRRRKDVIHFIVGERLGNSASLREGPNARRRGPTSLVFSVIFL